VKTIKSDFVILGAGWSGLLAAFFLSRNTNKKVIILEKDTEAGGLARTLENQNFKFDIGGHALFFKEKENICFLRNLVGESSLVLKTSNAKIFLENKYLDYPPTLNSIINMDRRYMLNIIMDMFKLRKSKNNSSFEDWVKSHYGETLYSIIFADYTKKVWGVDCKDLSSSWSHKRIGDNNIFKLFFNFVIKHGVPKECLRYFYYPQEGIGTLVDSLASRLNDNCKLFKGVKIEQFSETNGRISDIKFVCNGQCININFSNAISTIPLSDLISMVPNVPADIAKESINDIRYRSLILIGLSFKRKLISNWYWCYFPSKKIEFSRLHEPKLWSSCLAPEDETFLCSEIFCDYNDIYWKMSDSEITKRVYASLLTSSLIKNGEGFTSSCVHRIRHAYPLCYLGYEGPLRRVKDFLGNYDNLHLVGRNGSHSYADMEECLNDIKDRVSKLMGSHTIKG
jgi:protoporphyrinogen oxidase